jgi:hypothetical protein
MSNIEEGAKIEYTNDLAQYSTQIQDIETVCDALYSPLPCFENTCGY